MKRKLIGTEVNIDGNNVWLYIAENNGKIRIEDAGVNIK